MRFRKWLWIAWVIPENENDLRKGGEKETEVLLVAIHNDVIGEYKDIIAKAGLTVSSFEIESFSLGEVGHKPGSPTIAVMDIGSSAVKMSVVDYGVMKSSVLISKRFSRFDSGFVSISGR